MCGRLRHPRCGHTNLPSHALFVAPALKVKPPETDAPSLGARSPHRRRIGTLGRRWNAVPVSSPTGSMLERPCQPKAKKPLRGCVATRQTRRRRRALQALVWTIMIVASEISILDVQPREPLDFGREGQHGRRERKWYEKKHDVASDTRGCAARVGPRWKSKFNREKEEIESGMRRNKRCGQRHSSVRSHGLLA